MQPTLYILHAKQDVEYELALSQQLAVFEKITKVIRVIRDRDLLGGDVTLAIRQQAVDQADIVVLLITPAFWDEYELALRGMAKNKRVVPVLVNSTEWTAAGFGGYQPLPSSGRFIETLAQKDSAWLDVVKGLMRVWQSVAQVAAATAARAAAEEPVEPALPRPPLKPLAPGEKARVVFITANPSATARLQLTEELHQVKDRLLRTPLEAHIEVILEPELRLNQLAAALMRHRPHIVHFSGHGSTEGAIMLVDPEQAGGARALDPPALRQLFSILNEGVHCVVLNSCYSAAKPAQAQALSQVVGCVVGMDAPINDKSAIEFAASFYEGLGFGRSLTDSFRLGQAAVLAMGRSGHKVPQFYTSSDPSAPSFILGGGATPRG